MKKVLRKKAETFQLVIADIMNLYIYIYVCLVRFGCLFMFGYIWLGLVMLGKVRQRFVTFGYVWLGLATFRYVRLVLVTFVFS
jgi:hypothetical protein